MQGSGLYLSLALFSYSMQLFFRCDAGDQFCCFCPQQHIRTNMLVLIGCPCPGVSHSDVPKPNRQMWMGRNIALSIPREGMDSPSLDMLRNDGTWHMFGERFDLTILGVFSNLNGSVVLCYPALLLSAE